MERSQLVHAEAAGAVMEPSEVTQAGMSSEKLGDVEESTQNTGDGQNKECETDPAAGFVHFSFEALIDAAFTPEGHRNAADHVESSHPCGEDGDQPEQLRGSDRVEEALLETGKQDLVLGEETGQWGDSCDGQCPDQEGEVGERQLVPQSSHLAHVLLVMHGMDDRTGSEEQQGLEKRMGDQVEQCCRKCTHSHRKEHVAQLADGGVGQNLLDVVLGEGDECRQQGRTGAHRCDQAHGSGTGLEQWHQSTAQIDPRGHHGGCMNQCRDRCWTRHRVR